ncbi:zinc-binding metallopeptidase [Butyricimonas faecalis]|uniref:Lipoprotein n=1 Tax=Butyricimonas faecalis TaxID=2093856 RepID=A0A3S9VUH9_9BACT|nr:hypothetical protein [Butyricimonas faecalis]AZS30217.1 hypothetical protein D8S85_12135 [Butyricimonas faecalis]
MKMRIYISLLAILFLSGCAKDTQIGNIQVPGADYVLPQGGDAMADQRILKLYETYGSYFLYEFSEKDFNWTQISNSLGDDVFRFDPIEPGKVKNLLDLLQLTWFDFYDQEFLAHAMPIRIFLTETVQLQVRKFDWGIWDYILSWKDVYARYLDNQIAISNVNKSVADMSAEEKRVYKSNLQSVFLESLVASATIVAPDEFIAISDYSNNVDDTEEARNAGFVLNPTMDYEWSIDGNMTESNDLNAYLASLVFRTAKEWEDDLQYPLVKQKYDILVSWLKTEYGIDIVKIGNTIYE